MDNRESHREQVIVGNKPPFPYECGESVGTTAVEDGEGNSQGVYLTAHG